MTATDEDDTDGVPDPAGNLAALFESGDLELAYDTDTDELREFVEAAESGALGPSTPSWRPRFESRDHCSVMATANLAEE
jgi:hypothetical protein